MYGDLSVKLILAAKRAESLDRIPLYEHDLVQSIINENRELQNQIDGIDEINASSQASNLTMDSSRSSSVTNTPRRTFNGNFFSSSANNTPSKENFDGSTTITEIVEHLPEFVRKIIIKRNERCIKAYQMARLKKIEQLVWENKELSSEQLADLSYKEREYLGKYTSLVSGYKGLLPEVDLGGTLEPPNDVFVDVRVLKDAGEIMTEYGVFNLTKNSQFFVRKADVERLIQQGFLKEL